MWYDKYPGVPPRGSQLEALFLLVHVQRHEAEILGTKALILSSLADSNEETKHAIESYKSYCATMLPSLEQAKDLEEEQLRKRLLEHVRYPMRIDMGSIRKEQAAAARSKALTKYKVKRADLERWLKQ